MKSSTTLLLSGAAVAALLVAKKRKSVSGVGSYGGELDYEAAREIYLWFENTADLWHRYAEPLAHSLVKKAHRGYEISADYLAKSSMMDTIVRETLRDYARSFGSFYVSTATRKEMKRQIAECIVDYAKDIIGYPD